MKFLVKTKEPLYGRIKKKLLELSNDPFPRDVKRIQNAKENLYRVRVGDYRILYLVDHKSNRLFVVKIDKRPRVYHR